MSVFALLPLSLIIVALASLAVAGRRLDREVRALAVARDRLVEAAAASDRLLPAEQAGGRAGPTPS